MKNFFLSSLNVPVFAFLYCLASTSLAHHSFAAQYDADQPIELSGFVTKVEWTNPHARF